MFFFFWKIRSHKSRQTNLNQISAIHDLRVNNKPVTEPFDICEILNNYLTSIGPTLA